MGYGWKAIIQLRVKTCAKWQEIEKRKEVRELRELDELRELEIF